MYGLFGVLLKPEYYFKWTIFLFVFLFCAELGNENKEKKQKKGEKMKENTRFVQMALMYVIIN